MQISDLVGQYSRNINQDISVAAPAPESQQLVDAVREMTAGNIFEGTVNEMHRGEVVLGLSNGQTITAKLTGNISLSKGQSMFFQVKSNNGIQIEIRPYTKGNLSNPILLKALDTAGIPVNERTVAMVNAMMEEQMSIDKQSLMDMARAVATQPEIDVATIVQMKKLEIPVTPEMANQFTNYKLDQSAITTQMDAFLNGLPEVFSGEALTAGEAVSRNGEILDILFPGEMDQFGMSETDGVVLLAGEEGAAVSGAENEMAAETVAVQEAQGTALEAVEGAAQETEEAEAVPVRQQMDYPEGSSGRLLTDAQADKLGRQLLDLPQLAENARLFPEGRLNLDLSPKELLFEIQKSLQQASAADSSSVKKLLADEPYQKLLKELFEQEWLVKPEDLKTADKINALYQKLEHQMTQLERMFEQTGMDKSQLMRTAADVRGNVEFMNQINQNYTYLQIPLKLSGQNAHSDLYVYTNKKSLADREGDLTAFLHLDMDHLGSTDVSIRMRGTKVHTDFFLADDKSYDLILEHMDLLEERLERKGYQCTIQVQNKEKKVDFVEDFLKKDQPSTGRLHRYSFDVRA